MRAIAFVFVATAISLTLATLPNCRQSSNVTIPGATSQCDMTVDCAWCERNHLSFDFLCCELGIWIGPHLTNPLAFYLIWNNVVWTMLFVLAFEVFEVLVLTVFGSFDMLFADTGDYETLAGALLGDALIQGGLGLLIGYSLRVIFLAPTLGSTPERARGYDARGRRAVYFFVYLLLLVSFLLPRRTTDDGVRWGLMANTVVLLIFTWIVYPLAFSRDIDQKLIWTQLDGTLYGGAQRFWFFALWGVTIILSHSVHFATNQPTFAINEWYQQWIVIGPWALILAIMAFCVSAARSDGYTAWIYIGIALTIAWLLLWFSNHIFSVTSNALVYAGIAMLILAIIAYFIGALVTWPNTRIPHTRPRDRYSASEATRRAAEHVTVDANSDDGDSATPLVNERFAQSTQSTLRQRRLPTDYNFD